MKILLIGISLFLSLTAFAVSKNKKFRLIESNLKDVSGLDVVVEYAPSKRGPSSFGETDSIGSCTLHNGKLTVQVNKIWWLDIKEKEKSAKVVSLCRELF